MRLNSDQFSSVFIVILCLIFNTSEAIADITVHDKKIHIGDEIQWSKNEFKDHYWQSLSNGLPHTEHNYWVRIHVEVNDHLSIEQQAIFTSILGAYDIYWDGIKLSSNGVVGKNIEQEVPGNINFVTPIPQILWTSGRHVISLRISNYYVPKRLSSSYFNIRISHHQKTTENYLRSYIFPLVILGGIILIGGFFLLLHLLYYKKNTYALFSILCFLIASLLMVEVWRPLFGYSYDWHIYRLYCVGFLTFLIALLLPLFLVLHLKIKHQKAIVLLILTALLIIITVVNGFDNISRTLTQASLLLSLLITAWGTYIRQAEARKSFLAVLTVLLISLYFSDFQDKYFFPSFSLIIITVLVSLINQLSHVQQQRNRAQLLSAQLEISLLKKNIQPHFILNTLMSIEQWIIESPQSAIEFIDALAEEFKLLNEISSKQLIPINDELKLCRAHLKIMGFRHDLHFELKSANIPNELMLPPALLHTLLENCFTHNRFSGSPTTFLISCSDLGHSYKLVMTSPINSNKTSEPLNTGTGLKYIESSLTENFLQNWSISSKAINECWVTEISLPKP
jgi:hypothetical protein